MSKQNLGSPYAALGRRLKSLRVRAGESLAEVAGAVELEARELASYEIGAQRPSEDVLLLLISHFDVQDDEAASLWESAGYHLDTGVAPGTKFETDNKIYFTDRVDVIVNNYGVVMNFAQNAGQAQNQTVARIGMSREHAKSVLKVLRATLEQSEHTSHADQSLAEGNPAEPR